MPACQDADLELFLKQKIDMLHCQRKTGLLLVGCGFLLLSLGTGTICLLSKPCTSQLVPHRSHGSTAPTARKTFCSAGQHNWMSNECTFRLDCYNTAFFKPEWHIQLLLECLQDLKKYNLLPARCTTLWWSPPPPSLPCRHTTEELDIEAASLLHSFLMSRDV